MTPELAALAQRVEDLEKQVAHLAALAVEHSDTDQTLAARTVNARTFVVTDAHGVRRAELSMSIPEGRTEEPPWLGLFDADGNVRAGLGVEENGLPWLEFYDASQKCVLNVVVDEHGPRIGLFYGDGEPAVNIALKDAEPRMYLREEDGKHAVLLSAWKHGAGIFLDGANGKLGADVCVTGDLRSWVELKDASGEPRAALRLSPSGAVTLFMGKLGSETEPAPGPSLKLEVSGDGTRLLLGRDNKVIWSAP